MKVVSSPSRWHLFLWTVLGLLLVILLGVIDYLTGHELAFSLFYLLPILLVAWYANGRLGLLVSAASAIAWFVADYTGGSTYSTPTIYVWNTIIRLGFFVVVTALLSDFHRTYNANLKLLRTDYVSGAASARFFYEHAEIETARSRRTGRPITLAYIDLDNFKTINDRYGHTVGDRVLQAVAGSVQSQIRGMDICARLGGDEFALLLSDAGEIAARAAIARVVERIRAEMKLNDWPVTLSVGVVTFLQPPATVDEMVHLADKAMYAVKGEAKAGVSYQVYTPGAEG